MSDDYSFLKWKLYSESADDEVWKRSGNEREEEVLYIYKSRKTAKILYNYFELTDERLWKAQQEETDKFIKYSAAYGSWRQEAGIIDLYTAEFIAERLRENKDADTN